MCVCVCGVVLVLVCLTCSTVDISLSVSHGHTTTAFVLFRFSIYARLIAQRPQTPKTFMASHAGNSITLKSIYAYRLY